MLLVLPPAAFAAPHGAAKARSLGAHTVAALPDLNTNVVINGPGPDKLTVQCGTGLPYLQGDEREHSDILRPDQRVRLLAWEARPVQPAGR
jgi:hypothetical protein